MCISPAVLCSYNTPKYLLLSRGTVNFPHTAGLILASGLSQRLPGANKLLLPLGGETVIFRTAEAYVGAGLDPVVVVVGYQAELVAAALHDLPVRTVHNPDFRQGQSRALGRGIAALPDDAQAAVIGVGDQPLLRATVIESLLAAHRATGAPLVVPRYAGRRGNPILAARPLFAELSAVQGDQGGRPVLQRHRAEIAWVEVADVAPGHDLDTRADYDRLQGWLGNQPR